ncbi:MAG: cation-transporting P-type ATPase [Thermoplasmata archaeon]|nr:cation-transporting P-type ATPase [Thermoplasmata archaeon]
MTLKDPFYDKTVSETLGALKTNAKGLSSTEARGRLQKYGPNTLTTEVGTSKLLMFLSQFREVLVLVLIVAGIISFLVGSYRDGAIMFIIAFVNAAIGFVQEYKAGKILESLKVLIRSPAKVLRDGEITEIGLDELVPGDVVHLEEGDKVPADIRIMESFNLRTNDFSLTGESMPQEKHSNSIRDAATLGDRNNMAYLGTTVATGNATGVVVATGMNTEVGKIADLTQETSETLSPLQKELGMLGNRITVLVVAISACLFIVAIYQDFSVYVSLIYALGIAVAVVPQALPAQVTVALSTGSKHLAERKAVVKNLPSVETLGSTDVICTDKTGTLTKNEMTVRSVWFDGNTYLATGIGYEPKGGLTTEDGRPLTQEEIDKIDIMLDASTMASNAEIHRPDDDHHGWYPVGDPTEAALVTLSTKVGTRSPLEDEENPEVHEFPFDSERKRMSSVRMFGERKVLCMKGATESVLSITKHMYKDGKAVPITEKDRQMIMELNNSYSQQAMRVLSIAYRPLEDTGDDYSMGEIEKDVIFLGLEAMIDPPKEGVLEAIQDAHRAHIRTIMMTGDHAITAQAVGREVGLSEDGKPVQVVTGQEMHAMSDEELGKILSGEGSLIFSRVDPEDKLRIVKELESQGKIVAVTGDGVNDAPALKRAHIGVAMGQTGTDVAKEASELILLDDSFPTLVYAIEEGRTIYNNLKKTVLASMTTNGAELSIVLFGLMAVAMWDWAIPILAIQILAIDLLAEVVPLTFLTFDPGSEETMSSPPRKPDEHILDRFTSIEVVLLGALMGALAFMNFALFMGREGVELTRGLAEVEPILYARATTMSYVTIVYCQFANILSRRYDGTSLFNRNFWTNKLLLGSILMSAGLVFLGIYGPYLSDFLRFASLTLVDWLFIAFSTAIFLTAFEGIKVFKKARKKAVGSS